MKLIVIAILVVLAGFGIKSAIAFFKKEDIALKNTVTKDKAIVDKVKSDI